MPGVQGQASREGGAIATIADLAELEVQTEVSENSVAKLTPAPAELGLEANGLELITPDPNWAQVYPDGRALLISRDIETTARSFAEFSPPDAETWGALYRNYLAAKSAIISGMNAAPLSLAGEFANADAVQHYRFQFQDVRSWAEETFESPEVRNFLACSALHACLAPDDVLSAEFAWLFACAIQDVGVSIVKGGMHNVSRALAEVLQAHGGEVRTDVGVAEILCEGRRATGVRLKSGETIAADLVASNVDPRHFALDLLGEAALGPAIANKVKQYEWGQSFFAIYAALDGPVTYRAGAGADHAAYVHAAGQQLDELAIMFAQCRAGLLPERPMLGIINEAAMDPTRAPKGKGRIKLVAHFVPYRVRGDAAGTIAGTEWDTIKEAYADRIIALATDVFLPGLKDRIVARSVQSPVDMERRIRSAVHGTHQHGAYLPYQIGAMRPCVTTVASEPGWETLALPISTEYSPNFGHFGFHFVRSPSGASIISCKTFSSGSPGISSSPLVR